MTAVDAYWLKKLVANHSTEFGHKAGSAAAQVLQDRVREVFSEGGRANWSHVFRPAVGPDSQNRPGRDAENILVEGLRDVLLAWCEVNVADAKQFVDSLLKNDIEILRRIGIFALSEKWEALRDLYPGLVGPEFFDSGHLHELYGLLRKHFEGMTETEKTATVDALKKIPAPEGDGAELRLKHLQRRWLSAMSGTSYAPATTWLAELIAEVGPESKHPDYHVYMESSWGPGPSPYQVHELVSFAEERTIVDKLNAFEPTSSFRGPNREALAAALEKAVAASPATFIRVLPLFVAAKSEFQHSLLRALKQLWDNSKQGEAPIDWGDAWPRLMEFFETLLNDPQIWRDIENDRTQGWVVDAIVDLLHAGTRSDEHAYPPSLLARGWSLIQVLLQNAKALDEPTDDPMTAAINSSRGRSVEALFSHALRVCRLADKEHGSHADAWNAMKPVFDAEREGASGNVEFFTLAGAYLANLEYLDSAWLHANVKRLFPSDQPQNLACALGGLAYSPPTRVSYRLLRDAGALDAGLRLELTGRDVREKLIERIVIGYLWGEEAIDSPRLKYLFESGGGKDLEDAATFFRTIRDEELEEGQRQRIIDFWQGCVIWGNEQPEPPTKLLSSLSGLTRYLKDAAGKNADLLLAVAPYVHIHHHAYEFIEQLGRLVEVSPAEVSAVLGSFIEAHGPFYDYEDRMRSLVKRLADFGFKPDALSYCEKLRDMPGMAALFGELTAS